MTSHDRRARPARLRAGEAPSRTLHSPSCTAVRFSRGCCVLLASLLGISCSTGPKLDPEWNSHHLWHQVTARPPTYVPMGYPPDRPRTDHDGTWFADQRDGKRLFVPRQGVPGWAPGVLTGEAKKATGHDGRQHLTAGEKAWWGTTALFGAMAGVKVRAPD